MNAFTIDLNSLSSAFLSVKENHGCAGVDGVTIEHFERDLEANLKGLLDELAHETYIPLPLLKILVDKGNNEAGLFYGAYVGRKYHLLLAHFGACFQGRIHEDCP